MDEDIYGGTIQANFNDSNVWKNGKITDVKNVKGSGNLFTIKYDDGHVEENVPETRVREVPLSLGDLQRIQNEVSEAFSSNPSSFMYSRYNVESRARLIHSDIYVPGDALEGSLQISNKCKSVRIRQYIFNEISKSDCCLIFIIKQTIPGQEEEGKEVTIPFVVNTCMNEYIQFTYGGDDERTTKINI